MDNKSHNTSISLRTETYDLLQSIKSCFQLKNKRSITYDEIIRNFVLAGIEAKEPQISQILNLVDSSITNNSLDKFVTKGPCSDKISDEEIMNEVHAERYRDDNDDNKE